MTPTITTAVAGSTANSHQAAPPPPAFPGADAPTPGVTPPVAVPPALGVSAGSTAVNAATMLSTPYPYSSSRPGAPLSVAVAVSRRTTSGPFNSGYFARTNATAPATIAAASEVPVPSRYPPPLSVLEMLSLGAAISTSGPATDIRDRFPLLSTPATANTPGIDAG